MFSNMNVIHVHMPIFQWESEFWGDKIEKGHIEGPGEQREWQPQGPGQGVVRFGKKCWRQACITCIFEKKIPFLVPGVAVLVVLLDPRYGLCQPCSHKIRIPIEKLAYEHVSHSYLKK